MQNQNTNPDLTSYEDRVGDLYPLMNKDEYKDFSLCVRRFLFIWLVVVSCVMISAFSIDIVVPQTGALASIGTCNAAPQQRGICFAPASAAQAQNPILMSL